MKCVFKIEKEIVSGKMTGNDNVMLSFEGLNYNQRAYFISSFSFLKAYVEKNKDIHPNTEITIPFLEEIIKTIHPIYDTFQHNEK
jgi:hypothetical protein